LSERVEAVRGITLVERSDGMSRAILGAICSSPADYFRETQSEGSQEKDRTKIPMHHPFDLRKNSRAWSH
jgi:hypothetical protein